MRLAGIRPGIRPVKLSTKSRTNKPLYHNTPTVPPNINHIHKYRHNILRSLSLRTQYPRHHGEQWRSYWEHKVARAPGQMTKKIWKRSKSKKGGPRAGAIVGKDSKKEGIWPLSCPPPLLWSVALKSTFDFRVRSGCNPLPPTFMMQMPPMPGLSLRHYNDNPYLWQRREYQINSLEPYSAIYGCKIIFGFCLKNKNRFVAKF